MLVTPPAELQKLLSATPELARAFLVGGCVRDALLGLAVKDFDLEVFGVSYERLAKALRRWGRVDYVGQSFGVAKLTTGSGLAYDFAIPRRDRKVALGHKGFAVEFDADITPQEAASRRDFTLNALMFDPRCGEVLDFFGGQIVRFSCADMQIDICIFIVSTSPNERTRLTLSANGRAAHGKYFRRLTVTNRPADASFQMRKRHAPGYLKIPVKHSVIF